MACRNRGRDAIGITTVGQQGQLLYIFKEVNKQKMSDFLNDKNNFHFNLTRSRAMFSNMRAEPTSKSEWIKDINKNQVQPYISEMHGNITVVTHNGTIANDDKFNKTFNMWDMDKSKFQEMTVSVDSVVLLNNMPPDEIVGSYAFSRYDSFSGMVELAKNYMPLHVMVDFSNQVIWWSSLKESLLEITKFTTEFAIYDIPAYTALYLDSHLSFQQNLDHVYRKVFSGGGGLYPITDKQDKALVVCSGGLDSSTVATHYVKKLGPENVTLLHYHYGCKAQTKETEAVTNIAKFLGVEVKFMDLEYIFKNFLSSSLTDSSIAIVEGDEGIEYAKEWVPARNLILLSMAIGMAEKDGFNIVALGANLDEQSAFPDNSLDFIEKLDATSRYSVQNGHKIKVEAPLVNRMKHEIVKYALDIGAPLHLMVSCYQPTEEGSCGNCGPCNLRQIAFAKNGFIDDLIKYRVFREDLYQDCVSAFDQYEIGLR